MSNEAEKKVEGDLKNGLKAVRTRLGLSQSELAGRAGIARQTIGGIEAALYAPSAAVALRLARALGCRVEELFWLEEEPTSTLTVERAQLGATESNTANEERLLVARVGERWVGHSLRGDGAFRSEMIPADALAIQSHGKSKKSQREVQLLDSIESLSRAVLIAGCSPALSLWTRSAQRWHPGLRANWIHANSTQALQSLARGEVHIAGLHLCDPRSGEENASFVRSLVGDNVTLINFGIWAEGLLLQSGNPKNIRSVGDLVREDVRFVNREVGAGSRLLFDALLDQEGVSSSDILGYETSVPTHQAVAQAVASGRADAGMGAAAIARTYGLDFLPLRSVRFDFAVRAEFLREDPVSQLFETLAHKSVRLQLQTLGGYDTSQTGTVTARI